MVATNAYQLRPVNPEHTFAGMRQRHLLPVVASNTELGLNLTLADGMGSLANEPLVVRIEPMEKDKGLVLIGNTGRESQNGVVSYESLRVEAPLGIYGLKAFVEEDQKMNVVGLILPVRGCLWGETAV